MIISYYWDKSHCRKKALSIQKKWANLSDNSKEIKIWNSMPGSTLKNLLYQIPSALDRSIRHLYRITVSVRAKSANHCWEMELRIERMLVLVASFWDHTLLSKTPNSICIDNMMEEEMATYSCAPAWRIPWTEEPGRLPSMGLHKSDTTECLTHTEIILNLYNLQNTILQVHIMTE